MTRGRSQSPIASMTGAGVGSGVTDLGDTTVQVRAVNGRGLSVKLRLGPECFAFEHAVDQLVRSRLKRGSVTVVIEVTRSTSTSTLTVDEGLAEQAVESLRALAERFGFAKDDVDLRMLLSVPGVVQNTATRSRLAFEMPESLRDLLTRSLDDLIADRQREGRAITAAMLAHLDDFERQQHEVSARLPAVAAVYRERLLQRVNEFLEGRGRAMEDGDVVREVALFADRADVSEEVQRIATHVASARKLLGGTGEVGRRIEFLLQEILREVNTLGSKSPDTEVTARVVAMKSAIDKLKEQAANLE